MKFPKLNLVLILASSAAPFAMAQSEGGWRTDPRHPELQFRVKCHRETATIQWRSAYPGEVTAKFSVRSSTYDGIDGVTVPPAGIAETSLETEYCSPSAFAINVTRFNMLPPPPPPPPAPAAKGEPAKAAAKADAPVPPVLYIPRYQAPEELPTVSVQAISAIRVGMAREQVLEKLGAPLSQISVPEDDGELHETLHYNLPENRPSSIRLSNGTVVEVEIR